MCSIVSTSVDDYGNWNATCVAVCTKVSRDIAIGNHRVAQPQPTLVLEIARNCRTCARRCIAPQYQTDLHKMASFDADSKAIKARLADVDCPFTWDLAESFLLYRSARPNNDPDKDQDEDREIDESTPLNIYTFMNTLVKCFECVLSADIETAMKKLKLSEKYLTHLQEGRQLTQTIRVYEHIFYATKCYFLYETYDMEQLKDILENIVSSSTFTPAQKGALNGCKSIAFMSYYDFGIEKAIKFAKVAIQLDPDNASWYFALGKTLRRERRISSILNAPSDNERNNLEQAYAMSKNTYFGVYLARCKRESMYGLATRIPVKKRIAQEEQLANLYKEILAANPKEQSILLKLALGFMRLSNVDEMESAQLCLDRAEKINPDGITYLHYRGIFHEEVGNYKEAVHYFKRSADLNNFAADQSYVKYGWEIGEVDALQHSLLMLEKYKAYVNEKQQIMLLNVATCYYILKKNYRDASIYYLKAIEIDPQNTILQRFYKFIDFHTGNYRGGIYEFISRVFLPLAKKEQVDDPSFTDRCLKLETYCDVHKQRAMNNVTKSFGKCKF